MKTKKLSEIMEDLQKKDPDTYREIEENVKQRVLEYKGRGGARANAGRKKIRGTRIKISYEIDVEVFNLLDNMSKEQHTTKTDIINKAIKHLAKCHA
jgi:hypothetical protein